MKARSAGTSNSQSSSNGPYKRPNTNKPAEDPSPKAKNYTAEEVKLCNTILSKTNYYEILSVEKKADDNTIK